MKSRNGVVQPETTENVIPDFETITRSPVPFARSLQLILNTLERKAGADVACLYVCESNRFNLVVSAGRLKRSIDGAQVRLSERASLWLSGLQSPEDVPDAAGDWRVGSFPEVSLNGLNRLVVAPFRIDERFTGIMIAGWRLHNRNEGAERLMDGLTAAAAVLLARIPQTDAAAHIVAEIAQLEAELADEKIVARANEFPGPHGSGQPTVGIVHQHVQRVLDGIDSALALQQQLKVLRTQVLDRKLVDRAKAFRQQTRRTSEQEVYLRRRNAGQRERRPIQEIAPQTLSDRWA